MNKVLVTGGFGFIGGHLCRKLNEKCEVSCIDIDTRNDRKSLVNLEQGLRDQLKAVFLRIVVH